MRLLFECMRISPSSSAANFDSRDKEWEFEPRETTCEGNGVEVLSSPSENRIGEQKQEKFIEKMKIRGNSNVNIEEANYSCC